MSFAAIFSREFRLRRILLMGALFFGFAALAIPRLQGRTGVTASEEAMAAALILALVATVLFALVLGSGALARDLAAGRLAFDLARPTSIGAIWGGRFGAALALLALTAILVLAPSWLAGGHLLASLAILDNLAPIAGAVIALMLLLFLVHLGATLFASRSALLGFDLAALFAVVLLTTSAWTRLHRHWADAALGRGELAFGAFAVVVLAAASFAQVAFGRSDLARGHRALSALAWSGLLLGALGAEATSRWIVSPRLADLTNLSLGPVAPRGPWITVEGDARTRQSIGLLVNGESGRTLDLGTGPLRSPSPSFSADGSTVVWADFDRGARAWKLFRLDLTNPRAEPEFLFGAPTALFRVELSTEGRWLVLIAGDRVLLHDLDRKALIGSYSTSSTWEGVRLAWPRGANRLRIFRSTGGAGIGVASAPAKIVISEIELADSPGDGAVATRVEHTVGEIVELANVWTEYGITSLDGAQVWVRDRVQQKRLIFDGSSGAYLGEFPASKESRAAPLVDGTLATIDPETRTFLRLDPTGTELNRITLPAFSVWTFGGLASPNTLLVSAWQGPRGKVEPETWQLFEIDLGRSKVTEVGRGKVDTEWSSPAIGSEGARLVKMSLSRLGLWNPTTRRVEPLAAAR